MESGSYSPFDLTLEELRRLGFEKKFKEAVIVFKQSSFRDSPIYTLDERSYRVKSADIFFNPNAIGTTLVGDCLDGKDLGVRLDRYLYDVIPHWKVDYCYILEDDCHA